ncbi:MULTISPECIES: type II toxin-antitoxin system VapC family toxin [Mycolicibacter]|uniref:Twitching motility protein PilT n=2 Tax=Mycolicibacter algericus TaxID=1288388 RepID=A0A7I9YFT4_MYCAL|nr:type II toxin-antitoxin system VapC family toxin [Mycolicibacter algericus]OQZ98362.1 VapC toxin family PIN domain ribonuclease [Mycolicibacter algericus DSM 45454]GFG87363.1 twitching motility protein PilT [Mycolicibacter algericus]
MRYVLDTNVVSALRVRGRNPSVEAWAISVPVGDQFVAAVSIAEIERGVVAKERSDPAQGQVLRRWFENRVLPAFADRVLAFDLRAARILAAYPVPERAPLDDALIAAVAESTGMVVVTRNIKHFRELGVPCIDPWAVGATSESRGPE